ILGLWPQLRQVDENFDIVNTSVFQAVVNGDAPNTGAVSIDYTLPTTFDDGSALPTSPELPAGHKLILLIFMSVDNDAGFANDNTEIRLELAPDRPRMISFVNVGDFIPTDSIRPQFVPGEEFPIVLNYSTGRTDGVEEELSYVAMQVRQVDENGDPVKSSFFEAVLIGTADNADEVTIDYNFPTVFEDITEIPLSEDLPEGHRLLLLIFMAVDNETGFANDNTEIELVGEDPSGDRTREISWTNKDDYRPTPGTPPTFAPGQTFSMGLSYSTAKTGNTEEDLNYVAMMVRQVDENFAIVKTSPFAVVVGNQSPNFGDLTFDYTIPTAFDDDSLIPNSAELPAGHQLLLLVFMSVDSDAGFANDNTSIILDPNVSTDEEIAKEIL
ncbi:MAG: beta-agarase, partial [Bacteroidota bacterium]